MAAELDRCRSQKDCGFRMLTEKPNCLVIRSVLVSDVVCLIDNNQIEVRRRVQIQQALASSPPAASPRAKKERLV